MIGGKPTLMQRVQVAVGRAVWTLGKHTQWKRLCRLGWDIQSFSWGRGHQCVCGKRTRTEREHLTHECEPSVTAWLREYDA